MADSREELRRRRLAAQEQQQASQRRRLIAGYAVAGVLVVAVVIGLFVALGGGDDGGGGDCDRAFIEPASGETFDLEADCRAGTPAPEIAIGELSEAAQMAGCELRLNLKDEGNSHIAPDDPQPKWQTNPPTSGDHAPEFLADGAYLQTPNPRNFLHALEHGRIEIQYSSEIPEEDQLAIKGVFEESPDGMTFFPNDDMPHAVAVTAWTNMMVCDEYKLPELLDAIRDFRDDYRGQGPEPVPVSL